MPITPEQARAELARRRAAQSGAQDLSTQDPKAAEDVRRDPSRAAEWASAIYHPVLEVGAGTAGALLGAGSGLVTGPAAPAASTALGVAGGALGYAAGRNVANTLDEFSGIRQQRPIIQQFKDTGQDVVDGMTVEALNRVAPGVGRLAKPALNKVGRGIAKVQQGMSGAKWQDLKHAFKKGWGGLAGPNLDEAGRMLDEAEGAMAPISPEDQADILVNASGNIKEGVKTTLTKWLKNPQSVSADEALQAKRAVDSIYPSPNGKNGKQIGMLNDFKAAMDDIVAERYPEVKNALSAYRNAKVNSNLSAPLPVNKNGEYSKAAMLLMGSGSTALTAAMQDPTALLALGALPAVSPLSMGVVNRTAGSMVNAANKFASNPVARRAIIQRFIQKDNNQ